MTCAARTRRYLRLADPGDLARDKPDAHLHWADDVGVYGRCSLWWNGIPVWNGHRVGMVGHYQMQGAGGQEFLDHAGEQLREQDCTLAVGPMDGSTWRSYRLITSGSDIPRFYFEPDNPPEWVEHFLSSGFQPLATYFSAMNDDLTRIDPRIEQHAAGLAGRGVTLRPIRSEAFVEDMRQIFAVTRAAFRDNLFYADPDEAEFLTTYRPLLGKVPLELILLAEHSGRTVGFVFAVPDLNQLARPDLQACPTVIIKTLATLPERQYSGLGQWLLAEVQRRAHALGFVRAIHALVRDASHLRRISGRYARPIREYTLFGKVLSR